MTKEFIGSSSKYLSNAAIPNLDNDLISKRYPSVIQIENKILVNSLL